MDLLKRLQPSLVEVHCLAHKLELRFKDATKKSPLYEKKVVTLFMGLYYFVKNNPLNESMLKRSFLLWGKRFICQQELEERAGLGIS